MSSQAAIVTPQQLDMFADSLEESSKRLRGEGNKFRESVKAAQTVWKDEKYHTFRQQLEKCAEDLERVSRMSLKYSDFLREKAMAANKYLHRR